MAITFNDNINVSAGKALDSRYGPFDTTIIALDTVKILQRSRGLTIGIGDPVVVEYWFKDGIEDSNFVPKTASGNLTGITAGNGISVSGIATTPTVAIDTAVVQTKGNLSTNIITDATNAVKYPNVPAVKSYVDGFLVSAINDRGNFTPSATSPGAYPTLNGSGTGGAIMKGDLWFIRFAPGQTTGYLGTSPVQVGTSVRALVNSPSPTTSTDWDILDAGLGYIPENEANRINTIQTTNPRTDKYPSESAVVNYFTSATTNVPTLQQVVSKAVGSNISTGNDIIVRNLTTPTQTVTINSEKITLANTTSARTIDVGSNDKIRVQVGSNFTTYESDRITFTKSGSTSTLLAKDSNQTIFLPAPVVNNKVLAVSINGTYAGDDGNIVYNFLPSIGANYIPRMNATATALENSRIYDQSGFNIKFFTTNNRSMGDTSVQIGDAGGITQFLTETVAIESGLSHVGIYSVPGISGSAAASSLSLGRSSGTIGVSANSFKQTATINSNPTNPLDDNLAFSYNIRNQSNGTPQESSFPLIIYADGRVSIQGGTGDIPNNSGLAINAGAFALSGGLALYVNGSSLFNGEVRVESGQQLIVESLGSPQANLVIANTDGSLSTTGIPSGNINKIPKWQATATFATVDSQIFDDGTNVGIGTIIPTAKLDVSGTFKTSGAATIGTLATGTANSVVLESSGLLQKRTIDSRVWGSNLVSTSATPTTDRLARWTASNTVANSIIQDNGSRIGIGTAPDGTELMTIGGNLYIPPAPNPTPNTEATDSYIIKFRGLGLGPGLTPQTGEIKLDANGAAATAGCLDYSSSGFHRFKSATGEMFLSNSAGANLNFTVRNDSGGLILQSNSASRGIVLKNFQEQTSGELLNVTNGSGVDTTQALTVLPSGNVGVCNFKNVANIPQRALHIRDVMRLEPRASAPTSPSAGDIYYDSTVNKLRIYNGTVWKYVQFEP